MGAAQAGDLLTRANSGEITLQINLGRRQLAGDITVAGHPAGRFDGWLGLLRALDQALQTLDQTRPINGAHQSSSIGGGTP